MLSIASVTNFEDLMMQRKNKLIKNFLIHNRNVCNNPAFNVYRMTSNKCMCCTACVTCNEHGNIYKQLKAVFSFSRRFSDQNNSLKRGYNFIFP